jgi:recombination protein RecA
MLSVKGGEPLPKEDIISTPSFGLNYILGGGLWTGRYHVLWGEKGGGKSTLALYMAAEAQKKGYEVHLFDTESSLTDDYAVKCGVDLAHRNAHKGTVMEEILTECREVLRKGKETGSKNFFIIDSLNPIVPESEYEKDSDQKNQRMSLGASTQKMFIQRIHNFIIQDVNCIFVFISQMSMSPSGGTMWVPKANIGNYTTHMASNIIRVSPASKSHNVYDSEKGGNNRLLRRQVNWTIQKSKQGAIEGVTGHYYFDPSIAEIDWKEEVIDIAASEGLIPKNGSWFTWNDSKIQGPDKLRAAIDESDGWNDLKNTLLEMNMTFDYDDGGSQQFVKS